MREKGKARARNKLQLCSVLLPESFGDAAFGHPPCPFGTRRSGFSRGPSSPCLVRSRTYQRGDAMKLCCAIVAGNTTVVKPLFDFYSCRALLRSGIR